jgi:hypothetical protein
MNKTLTTILVSALFFAAPAFACDYPERPDIPDGASATKDQMLEASTKIKEYLADVDTYLTCIEEAERDAVAAMEDPSPEELQRRGEMLDSRFSAANEEKALVGEMFNQEVRAYNAKSRADKE